MGFQYIFELKMIEMLLLVISLIVFTSYQVFIHFKAFFQATFSGHLIYITKYALKFILVY